MASRLRLFGEYVGVRAGLALVGLLPPRRLFSFVRFLGSISFRLLRARRRTAVENILKAGVADDPRTARRLARESFRSVAQAVAESIVASRLIASGRRDEIRAEYVIPDETRALFEDPAQGLILVSGHIGNWELAPKLIAEIKPITGIARRMDNPRVQALLEGARASDRFEIIDKHDAHPMKIVRALRRHRILVMLTDQHARGDSACIVDYFGRPAKTYTTPAVLQHLTGAPIVFGVPIRTGDLSLKLILSEPIRYHFDKATLGADVKAATQDIAKRLEEWVRRYPEQYLWAHRRWKVGVPRHSVKAP